MGQHEDGFEHERIVIVNRDDVGLRAAVAVHSTVLGPALGGLRMKPYPGGMEEALADVRALARTMTLKAAAAGLELGGGKAVILDDGDTAAREARLEAFGEVVESLGGAYITAEDIGTTTADMEIVARTTSHVVGRDHAPAPGVAAGDPSPATASTTLGAIREGLRAATGSDDVAGRVVGVVGLGKVGGDLAARLRDAGAQVVACDLDPARVEALGVEGVPASADLLARDLDVLAPCATGGLIDVPEARALRARVVAGAANNPLASRAAARVLHERGIVHVPDFIANCGGLIHVDAERRGAPEAEVDEAIERAIGRMRELLERARADGAPEVDVAERMAWERVRGGVALAV